MQKESLGLSLAKLILTVSFIIGGGAWLGTVAYSLAHPEFAVNFGQIINPTPVGKAINKIEISADKKSPPTADQPGAEILNAETKAVIFTIADTQKYLKNAGYFYNPDTFQTTNAKYEGDCFTDAALSNNKDRIVFSTGCLPGDLPQTWVGSYDIPDVCAPTAYPSGECHPIVKFRFLIGGSGRNFVWSVDDKTITYEADLGLSGMTETRTIDSATGEILERRNTPTENDFNIKDWQTYKDEKHGFDFKYPVENIISDTKDSSVTFWKQKSDYDFYIKNRNKSEFAVVPYYFILNIYDIRGQNFENWIKEKIGLSLSDDLGKLGFIEKREMFINNIKIQFIHNGEGQGDGIYYYFIKNNDTAIVFSSFRNLDFEDSNTFNQILSTFKFIEPEK